MDQSSKIRLPPVPGEGGLRGPGRACATKCQAQIETGSCFVPSGLSVWQVEGSFLPSPYHSWLGGQGSSTSSPRSASPCAQSLLGDLWRHGWCCPRAVTLGRDDWSCTQCGEAPTQPCWGHLELSLQPWLPLCGMETTAMSQNHRTVGVGKDLWRSSSPPPRPCSRVI